MTSLPHRTFRDGCDAVVVGAGPYGLSAAAHLRAAGLDVAVFGKPLELWRDHMPDGMFLRSRCETSSLSDPRGAFGFDTFLREHGYDGGYPIPRQRFVEYGLWFQRRAVPDVDETYVASIARDGGVGGGFLLTLADGRVVRSRAVVMATGLTYYTYRPDACRDLPPELVSHSCDHADLRRFAGREVVVVGRGQSAIEYAALLHDGGARVHVVARGPIAWRARDRSGERTTVERLLAPDASIAPGWRNWALDHLPYLFFRLPQRTKDDYNSNYSSGAADWLRERVIGKVTLHEGRTVYRIEAAGAGARVAMSGGESIDADHVVFATGYAVDVTRLGMLDAPLRGEIACEGTTPVLNAWFESSVPGLYFVGLTALRAFGPLYRFVAGCGATARRVTKAIARANRVPVRARPHLPLSPTVSRS